MILNLLKLLILDQKFNNTSIKESMEIQKTKYFKSKINFVLLRSIIFIYALKSCKNLRKFHNFEDVIIKKCLCLRTL